MYKPGLELLCMRFIQTVYAGPILQIYTSGEVWVGGVGGGEEAESEQGGLYSLS